MKSKVKTGVQKRPSQRPVDQKIPAMTEGLSIDFLRIWQSGDFSDVTLICSDGGMIAAHRQILASRSEFFARMMFGNLKEGGEKEVKLHAKEKVVRLLLTHLYSNQVTLKEELVGHLAELLDLADDLGCALVLQVRAEPGQLRHWFSLEHRGVIEVAAGSRRETHVDGPVVQAAATRLEQGRHGAILGQLAATF